MNMKFEHAPGGAMAIHAKVPNQLVFKADGTLESATKPDLKTASPETLATVGAVREMNRMPLFFQGIHNGTREGLQRVYKGCATPNDAIQISALTHPELVKAVLRGDVATCDEAAFQADPYQRGKWSRGTAYLDDMGKPQGWVRTPDLNQAMPDSLPPPFVRGGADAKAGSIGKDTMRRLQGGVDVIGYNAREEVSGAYGVIKLGPGVQAVSSNTSSSMSGNTGFKFDSEAGLPEGHTGTEFAPWHIYGVSYSIISNGVFNEGAIDAEQVGAEVLQLRNDLIASGMVVFDTPGVQTWQVPEILRSGKKKARVRGVGGGGGAARRSTASNVAVTGGSGAGGFDVLVDLTGVVTVAVTVGAAGTVGATADSVGTPGGSTSFGAYASAEGGLGGLINGNVPLGGNAYSSLPGALLIRGGSPSASVSSSSGSTFGGGGGSSILGIAGGISGSGVPASGYGAGAGGSVTSGSPLSTSGVVIIEW